MIPPVLRKLNAEFAQALQSEKINRGFDNLDSEPISIAPEAFGEMLGSEIGRYTPIVKAAGAKIN